MKKMFLLFLVLILSINCTGCEQAIYSVQLKQSTDQINSITFVDVFGTDVPEIVCEIESDSAILDAVADIQNLDVGRYFNDPATSYGYLYIEIRYKNGDVEIIGTGMFDYTSIDGTIDESYGGWYYVDLDSMRALFTKYRST